MNTPMLEMIMTKVLKERQRQERLKKEGRFKNTPNEVPLPRSYLMLSEEMGEVARCILAMEGYVQEQLTEEDCHKELIQVMAIAAAMVEGIETIWEDRDRFVLEG